VDLAPPTGLAAKLNELGQGKRDAQFVPFHFDPDRLAVSGLHAMGRVAGEASREGGRRGGIFRLVRRDVDCLAKVSPERPPGRA
jgi:hypothetical protein